MDSIGLPNPGSSKNQKPSNSKKKFRPSESSNAHKKQNKPKHKSNKQNTNDNPKQQPKHSNKPQQKQKFKPKHKSNNKSAPVDRKNPKPAKAVKRRKFAEHHVRPPSRPFRMPTTEVKKTGQGTLRVITVGGNEEVGRNCTIMEYDNDIIIIDLGLQFPEEGMPGVNYIIPNLSYLKGKEKNIRGVLISHGHYDHIGAIPHVMESLGNPPIFAAPLALGIIEKRQTDFPNAPKLKSKKIKGRDVIKFGQSFSVEFMNISHSFPDSMAMIVHTPIGTVVHTGDFKIDLDPEANGSPTDIGRLAQLHDENVLALMSDSTNATRKGHQLLESDIQHNLDDIIEEAEGRIVIGTFASTIGRVNQILKAAERLNRKVVIQGYSMRTNIAISQQLGYLKIKPGTIIEARDAGRYKDNQILILTTGAQGESNAGMTKIANRDHPFINVQPNDTVVFSSSVIPGNERSVQSLKDTLLREGAKVIHYQMLDIHAGGHAAQEDLKLALRLVNPEFLIPIEGNHHFLHAHADMAKSIGFPEDNIFIADNGQIIEFTKSGGTLTNHRIPSDYVYVDGLGVGSTDHVVLRDRQRLADDGMVVVVVTVDGKTGQLASDPEILARGFTVANEDKLISKTVTHLKEVLRDNNPNSQPDEQSLKKSIQDDLGVYLYKLTEKRPMILPMVVKV